MNIDISICDLQLLDISLPFIWDFHAGFNTLSMYDKVSTCVMFYSVDIHYPSVQLLNVSSKHFLGRCCCFIYT